MFLRTLLTLQHQREKSPLKMEPNTQVNGWALKDTGMVFRYGLTTQGTKVAGETIRQTEKESFIMQMEMSMMEIGKMTKLTVKVNTLMQMVRFMMEIG